MVAAAIGSTVASVGGSLISANAQEDASKREVKQQQAALSAATAAQQQGYQQAQNYLNPYYQQGAQASSLYNSILTGTPLNQTSTYDAGFGATNGNSAVTPTGDYAIANQIGQGGPNSGQYSAFFNSPDYQFTLQQGLQALNNSASAQGNLLSGQQQIGIQNYAQGKASEQYNNFMNRLQGVAAQGQNAGTSLSNAAIGQASALGGIAAQQGNVAAAGTAAQTNAFTGGIQNSLGSLGIGAAGGTSGIYGGSGGGSAPLFGSGSYLSNSSLFNGGTDLGSSMPWLSYNV